MNMMPWDQRVARVLVRPLAKTPITANHLTSVTLLVALAGAGLLAVGTPSAVNWGAGLFITARFLDHFDGELARLKEESSRFGYYFDYVAGAISYAAMFLCTGIGLAGGTLGLWALVLGGTGAAAALISMFLNLGIDRAREETGDAEECDAVGYPGFAGFELEDGIYLLAPITWLGFLMPFFATAGTGAGLYCIWTLGRLLKLRGG